MIPQSLNIYNYEVSTSFLVLLLAGAVGMVVYWHEIKRDGFDPEKAIDLFLISILSAILISRITFATTHSFNFNRMFFHTINFWRPGYDVLALFIGLIFLCIFFQNRGSGQFLEYPIFFLYPFYLQQVLFYLAGILGNKTFCICMEVFTILFCAFRYLSFA